MPRAATQRVVRVAERRRIEALGGQVARRKGSSTFRVYDNVGRGGLAMARALGDTFYGDAVPARADFTHARLDARVYSALVVATDGLWDVMSVFDACEAVRRNMTRSPEDAARALVREALELNTSDNTSAVVVYIESDDDVAMRDRNDLIAEQANEYLKGQKERERRESGMAEHDPLAKLDERARRQEAAKREMMRSSKKKDDLYQDFFKEFLHSGIWKRIILMLY